MRAPSAYPLRRSLRARCDRPSSRSNSAALRAELDADAAQGEDVQFPRLHALRAAAFKGATELRIDHGANLDPVAGGYPALMGIRPEEYAAEQLPQAMLAGTTPRNVYAVGVLDATEQRPDAFGSLPDREAIAKWEQEIEAVCAPIGALWTRDDVTWVQNMNPEDGSGFMEFKKWPVRVYPLHNVGPRLIEHIASKQK